LAVQNPVYMQEHSRTGKDLYHERQSFRQLWLWILLLFVAVTTIGIFGYGIYHQLILGKSFGNNPMSDTGLIVTSVLMVFLNMALFGLFIFGNLTTTIDRRGISYRFFPFHRKYRHIELRDIERWEVVKYRPIKEYGGWGIRYGRLDTAYNVSGNMGLRITLKNRKRFLFGTRRPEALNLFMENLMKEVHSRMEQ